MYSHASHDTKNRRSKVKRTREKEERDEAAFTSNEQTKLYLKHNNREENMKIKKK